MAWHDIPYMSNKKHTFNVINLIATFVFFIGLVGFIVSFAHLFHQWEVLNNIKVCFEKVQSISDVKLCREYFYQTTGVALPPDKYIPDSNIRVRVLFLPLIWVFLSIIGMLLGMFIYNIGNNWHMLVNHHIYKDYLQKKEYPSYLSDTKRKHQKR